MSLRVLVDCGASNNFVRHQSLDNSKPIYIEREIPPTRMTVRLATCASVTVMKRVVGISHTLKEVQYDDDFIVLDLDDKFDIILGLPWLRRYEPQVIRHRRSVDMTAACSPEGHLMNVLEHPPPYGFTTSTCDGLTCFSVVSMIAQNCNVSNHHILEQVPGDCTETQKAPEAHHSNKSSGPGNGCLLSGQHADNSQPIANNCQYEDELAQKARVWGISSKQTLEISSHDITAKLNVLVNDGSSIGSYTLDLIAPRKLTSAITQLSPLNKRGSCVICVVEKSSRSAYSLRRMSKSLISDIGNGLCQG